MKIYKLICFLLLGIVVLSVWGCRDILDQPTVANVGDVIDIKVKLKYEGTLPAAGYIVLAMQIPEDWEFISMTSDNDYFNNYYESLSGEKFASYDLGLKEGYKWICGINLINDWQELKEINTILNLKLKVGYNIKGSVLLDYAANYCYQGWNYKIIDSPILIFDQRIDLDIPFPCTSKGGDKTAILLNYENNSLTFNSDIYFLMQDATGNIYSYPSWDLGIRPFLTKFSIPEGAKIENAKILDIAYPSDKPKIHDGGYYNFFLATIASDAPTLLGKYGNHLYLVGNEPPTPDLSITGEEENFPCENRQIIFDASNSWDLCDSIDELLVRFDFEGDGVWDTEFQTNKIKYHVFPEPAIYYPIIELKDTGGLISSYQTDLDILTSDGDWEGERDTDTGLGYISSINFTEYLNFTISSNQITCSYGIAWWFENWTTHYVGYYPTKGTFQATIEDEKFGVQLNWGYISGKFDNCTDGSISFLNYDKEIIDGHSRRVINVHRKDQ